MRSTFNRGAKYLGLLALLALLLLIAVVAGGIVSVMLSEASSAVLRAVMGVVLPRRAEDWLSRLAAVACVGGAVWMAFAAWLDGLRVSGDPDWRRLAAFVDALARRR